jgi:hypothetical protein
MSQRPISQARIALLLTGSLIAGLIVSLSFSTSKPTRPENRLPLAGQQLATDDSLHDSNVANAHRE